MSCMSGSKHLAGKSSRKKNQANSLLYSQTSLHTTQAHCLYWWSQNLRSRIHPSDAGDSLGGSRGGSCSASFSRYGKVCTAKVFCNIIFPAAFSWMSRMNPFLATEDRPGCAPPHTSTLTHVTYVYDIFIAYIVIYLCIRTTPITVYTPKSNSGWRQRGRGSLVQPCSQ